MYKQINPNPLKKNVGDCTVRAIALALNKDWDDIYLDLCLQGYVSKDMPSSNEVWGAYLAERGWTMHRLQDSCPMCYTIEDFCKDHPDGTFIVATGTHVVCVRNGNYQDTWDSGTKTPMFYFERET